MPKCSDIDAASPINDTAFNRYCTLTAIACLRRLRPVRGCVLMLTDRLCVKYGSRIHLSEAMAMQFISQNTSMPVPEVFCAFVHRGCTYLVMERIRGHMIGAGWIARSETSRSKLLAQLRAMVQEMRLLTPPQGIGVASVSGGSLFDCRLPGPALRYGPFADLAEFHLHLREGIAFDTRLDQAVQDLIQQQEGSWPIVFTHGDLSSLNVLVSGDEVVAVIDWETAGWFPSYWEYTTACQVNPQNSFWIHEIDKFLSPMPEEAFMERIRQKYFGAF